MKGKGERNIDVRNINRLGTHGPDQVAPLECHPIHTRLWFDPQSGCV